MELKQLFRVLSGVFYNPEKSIKMLKEQGFTWKEMFFFYAFPLITINTMIRALLVGEPYKDFSANTLFFVFLLSTSISIFAGSYLIKLLASRYLSSNNFNSVFSLVAVSYTPVFLASIVSAINPVLYFLRLIGIVYMFYIFWKGANIMLNTPQNRVTGFTILCLLILFGVTVLVSLISGYLLFFLTGNFDLLLNE